MADFTGFFTTGTLYCSVNRKTKRFRLLTEMTRLEKIANGFIEGYVRDHPIMAFSIGDELKEYVERIPELNTNPTLNEILREYLSRSH